MWAGSRVQHTSGCDARVCWTYAAGLICNKHTNTHEAVRNLIGRYTPQARRCRVCSVEVPLPLTNWPSGALLLLARGSPPQPCCLLLRTQWEGPLLPDASGPFACWRRCGERERHRRVVQPQQQPGVSGSRLGPNNNQSPVHDLSRARACQAHRPPTPESLNSNRGAHSQPPRVPQQRCPLTTSCPLYLGAVELLLRSGCGCCCDCAACGCAGCCCACACCGCAGSCACACAACGCAGCTCACCGCCLLICRLSTWPAADHQRHPPPPAQHN